MADSQITVQTDVFKKYTINGAELNLIKMIKSNILIYFNKQSLIKISYLL